MNMGDKYYPQQSLLMQDQARRQLQKDSFILIDMIHRTISSAEKYALGNHKSKKYGFWDEMDTASFRGEDDLHFEFLAKIQTVIGGLKEFNALYPSVPIPFYDKIPKEVILKDLLYFKEIVSKDKKKYHNAKLYDQLINILNGGKYNILSKEELMKGIPQDKKYNEQDIRNVATEIFQQNAYNRKGLKDASNYIDNTNAFYQPGELGVAPGRGYGSNSTVFDNK